MSLVKTIHTPSGIYKPQMSLEATLRVYKAKLDACYKAETITAVRRIIDA